MAPRELLAERFLIEEEAVRQGGIGAIHRGRDTTTGQLVAIKVLRQSSDADLARFLREAEVLASLTHPAIVGHVAHGITPDGEPYLVMEWLAGQSLAERLGGSMAPPSVGGSLGATAPSRGVLGEADTMTLARRIADALAFAHAQGLVHRDIKPANIFLVDGDVAQSKLIDFGVARADVAAELTDAGIMVGTLGYMAPEQARGERRVDPRADVFALGCVLYKCLVGRAPFVGENLTAVLAKTLFEDAPRLRDVMEDAPPGLDRLLARMLAKDPYRRPAGGAALLMELEGLSREPSARRLSTMPPPQRQGITAGEQSLVSVVLAAGPGLIALDETLPTPAMHETEAALAGVRGAAAPFGAQVDALANGLVVATLAGSGNAADQAAQAGRCALAMAAALDSGPVVLAVGRGVLDGRLPMGAAIDRAARLLRDRQRMGTYGGAASRPETKVIADEVAAGLLAGLFELRPDGGASVVVRELESPALVRTLLGKPTPFVGRARELGVLRAVLEACIDEPSAQCVLVTGDAGIGKSRLRYEFLRDLRARSETPLEIWSARGEPIATGSPLRMLSQMVRGALGLAEGDGGDGARERISARVRQHGETGEAFRVAEFLGELVGVPFPDEGRVQLRAARGDAVLRGDQMRRAFQDFLAAEVRVRPVVLVLEDLHWGDHATVEVIDGAVRSLVEQPLLVIALGRPEVKDRFERVWARTPLTQVELSVLSPKASERLVRDVLSHADAALVKRLVERAEGNAFFLEELIRAVAERNDDSSLPETVVAMVQARLGQLDPDDRRILRAASIFGEAFHPGGVDAILGGHEGGAPLADLLDHLVELELLSRRSQSRFPAEPEYVFRHAHLREAAYAMLTDHDRALGHRLAGDWLVAAGERDAFALAEHFERGGAQASAALWYRRAAEQALEANDLAVAQSHAERGARATSGDLLGALRLLQAEIHAWRGEHAGVLERGEEAMAWLEQGSDLWHEAAGQVAEACGRLGHHDRLSRLGEKLLELTHEPPPEERGGRHGGRQVVACVRCATQLMFAGRFELAQRLTAAVEGRRGEFAVEEPAVAAWVDYASSVRALFAGDLGDNVKLKEDAVAGYERAGDQRNACIQRVRLGYAWSAIGAHASGERVLREALTAAERMGLAKVSALAKHNLGLTLARLGRLGDARLMETEALEAFEAQGDRRLAGASHLYLAWIHTLAGNTLAAELHARASVAVQESNPPSHAEALATLARVLLAGRRYLEAMGEAQRAKELLDTLGGVEDADALIRLVHAECLHAVGKKEEALAAVRDARTRLLARADRIRDPELRRLFLEEEPDNQRTLHLVQAWSTRP